MKTIVAENLVKVAPAASIGKTRISDEEPRLPESHYAEFREDVKHGRASSSEHIAVSEQHQADHKVWEARMEKKGRGYTAGTVRGLALDSQVILMDYLRLTGAPDEILKIAEWQSLAFALQYSHFWKWSALSYGQLVQVGQLVPILRSAIKSIKFYPKAPKNQYPPY